MPSLQPYLKTFYVSPRKKLAALRKINGPGACPSVRPIQLIPACSWLLPRLRHAAAMTFFSFLPWHGICFGCCSQPLFYRRTSFARSSHQIQFFPPPPDDDSVRTALKYKTSSLSLPGDRKKRKEQESEEEFGSIA